MRIYLVDTNQELVSAWIEAFSDCPAVVAACGDFFGVPADAMVSPANSFGVMDGGLDLAIRNVLGETVERRVQDAILANHHGEMVVGEAEIVGTGHASWPWLVAAPTMRIPSDVRGTLAAYLAFRAVLLEVETHNRSMRVWSLRNVISSILCPGLGTGVGKLDPKHCAMQMRHAYDVATKPARLPGYAEAVLTHGALTGELDEIHVTASGRLVAGRK